MTQSTQIISNRSQFPRFLPHQSEQTQEHLCHQSVVGSSETSL